MLFRSRNGALLQQYDEHARCHIFGDNTINIYHAIRIDSTSDTKFHMTPDSHNKETYKEDISGAEIRGTYIYDDTLTTQIYDTDETDENMKADTNTKIYMKEDKDFILIVDNNDNHAQCNACIIRLDQAKVTKWLTPNTSELKTFMEKLKEFMGKMDPSGENKPDINNENYIDIEQQIVALGRLDVDNRGCKCDKWYFREEGSKLPVVIANIADICGFPSSTPRQWHPKTSDDFITFKIHTLKETDPQVQHYLEYMPMLIVKGSFGLNSHADTYYANANVLADAYEKDLDLLIDRDNLSTLRLERVLWDDDSWNELSPPLTNTTEYYLAKLEKVVDHDNWVQDYKYTLYSPIYTRGGGTLHMMN